MAPVMVPAMGLRRATAKKSTTISGRSRMAERATTDVGSIDLQQDAAQRHQDRDAGMEARTARARVGMCNCVQAIGAVCRL